MSEFDIAEDLRLLARLRDRVSVSSDEEAAFARFCLNNVGWSQAQFLQDLWVAYELDVRQGGYFVEFGAADGLEGSNTYALERRLNWSGVIAEPAHVWRDATRANRTCAVDQRCVWTHTGETLVFNQTGIAAHSTIDAYSDSDRHGPGRANGLRYAVETVSLNDLLADWRAPQVIDYLSVDTEGSEYDILSKFDFDRYDVRLLTVEHNFTSQRDRLHALLTEHGYRRKFDRLSFVDDWYIKS